MASLSHSHAAHPTYSRTRVWLTCAMAALAGLLFGLDIGVIAGAFQGEKAAIGPIGSRIASWVMSSLRDGITRP